jgi:hypothetical protein
LYSTTDSWKIFKELKTAATILERKATKKPSFKIAGILSSKVSVIQDLK